MKIAMVIQRYGTEVNGGAEMLALKMAEHINDKCDITVITTCAKDYDTWKNEYPKGESKVNGVKVLRFPVKKERNLFWYKQIDRVRKYSPIFPKFLEELWLKMQGPYTPECIEYIKANKDEYDCFIFVTYLYYTSVKGLPVVKEKSIFIPAAHDEPFLKMKTYKKLFESPAAFWFNAREEEDLVKDKFDVEGICSRVGGMGIEVPDINDSDKVNPESFCEKYKDRLKNDPYVIYVGRIDYGKNCHKLFDDFMKIKDGLSVEKPEDTKIAEELKDLRLVLLGKPMIDIPERNDIVSLGFVSEKDKYDAMAGAVALILPSEFESFSIVVLESMALKVPVIVNGDCAVTSSHCKKSGAGFTYKDPEELKDKIMTLMSDEELRRQMGEKGAEYVRENYRWDVITDRFMELVRCVAGEGLVKD
ncbi:MAG TPA: hexosyltransferase [Lachnospiraceae bacterium]|nr:hexosyltransferase [Lachnospiraceae bacterium]